MKASIKSLFAALLALFILLCSFGCGEQTEETPKPENTDYASQVKLDISSETKKQTVTVKSFIDGDTTHFYVPTDIVDNGVLKARYLGINTPESTGKIEEYGKAASAFTRSKLESATSIIIESDDGKWNLDSTGSRYLVWVWYKTEDSGEYRNLNIEILQNGLAIASSSANNRYGQTCVSAIAYAKEQKLNVYSGQNDPDFYYGEAVELTLKELRCNIKDYLNIKVAFEGVITVNSNNSVYIESYDEQTDMYYGISVYYGYGLDGNGLDILSVGNKARIVGSVQYYEAGDSYQISGVTYRVMKPKDPSNLQKLGDGYSPAYVQTDADTFANAKVKVELYDGDDMTSAEYDYAYLALNSSIEMRDLKVIKGYTTEDESSSSYGAITLVCSSRDGITVNVRTVPLKDESGTLISEDAYIGHYIDVRGIIDKYNGQYQIKVFSKSNITVY